MDCGQQAEGVGVEGSGVDRNGRAGYIRSAAKCGPRHNPAEGEPETALPQHHKAPTGGVLLHKGWLFGVEGYIDEALHAEAIEAQNLESASDLRSGCLLAQGGMCLISLESATACEVRISTNHMS